MAMARNPRRSNGSLREKHRRYWKSMGLPCAICGGPIDYSLGMVTDPRTGKRKPHPMSFVIDEIVPVSRYREGGYSSPEQCAQDRNNQRPAHWICNARRGDGTRGARADVHVVMGAPCSGKTTLVGKSKAPGDVVIDLDAIARALGHDGEHGSSGAIRNTAYAARKAAIRTATKQACRVWIIHTQPNREQVDEYARMGAKFHLCDPGEDECLKRAKQDGRPRDTAAVIRQWYSARETRQTGTMMPSSGSNAAHATRATADHTSGTF